MTRYEKNALLYSIIVAIGGFLFGLDAALISGTTDFITREFSLTAMQLGDVVSAPALGVLLALPFAGFLSDRFGRKRTLQIIAMLYLISAVSSALAPTYLFLVFARFLGGLAFTSISLASMYIGEIAPPKWRGKLVAMIQINIVIGLSGAYFINYLIHQWATSGAGWVQFLGIDKYTWRWMLGSEILPALAWFGLLILIPKSPAWLVTMNRIDEARQYLKKIMPSQAIDKHLQEMQESIRLSQHHKSIWSQLKEIFSKPMRRVIVIAFTIAIAQQATGINAILFYANTVFEQLAIGADAAFVQSIWIGITSIVFTVLGLLLIDKVGRRPLIIGGMIWIILSLGVCSYAFNEARYMLTEKSITELSEIPNVERLRPLVGKEYKSDIEYKYAVKSVLTRVEAQIHQSVLLEKAIRMNATLVLIGILSFIAAFHFSVGPVMWVLFSEIFPISVRAIAIPFFTIITSLTNYLVQKFFPWQMENMGMSVIFIFYATMVIIGVIILFFSLIETKNMSIEEIQLKFMKKSKKA